MLTPPLTGSRAEGVPFCRRSAERARFRQLERLLRGSASASRWIPYESCTAARPARADPLQRALEAPKASAPSGPLQPTSMTLRPSVDTRAR